MGKIKVHLPSTPRNQYNEKKLAHNAVIIPTAATGLTALATSRGISRSNLLECIGRDEFALLAREDSEVES